MDISGLRYENAVVTDFETGGRSAVSSAGVVEVELPRREFVLLEVKGE